MKKIILQVFFIYIFIASFNIVIAFEMATENDIVLVKHEELKSKHEKKIIDYCEQFGKYAFHLSSHPLRKLETFRAYWQQKKLSDGSYQTFYNSDEDRRKDLENKQKAEKQDAKWTYDVDYKNGYKISRFFCAKSPKDLIILFSKKLKNQYSSFGGEKFVSSIKLENRYLFFEQLQYQGLFSATKTWCGEKYISECIPSDRKNSLGVCKDGYLSYRCYGSYYLQINTANIAGGIKVLQQANLYQFLPIANQSKQTQVAKSNNEKDKQKQIEQAKKEEEKKRIATEKVKAKSTTKVSKTNLSVQVATDTSSPNIIVSEEFESNSQLMAEISGSINDESEIASLTIDGYEVSLNNSNFKKEFFVKPKGQDVEIVAIDIHGNKSSKIVTLKRQKEVIQQVKLDSLNPTRIQSEISTNKAALIIGVEIYKNTFSALYAENDALYFNDFAFASLGVPKENIKLLINNDAGRNDALGVVKKWLPKVIRDNETHLYVYFSGHGLASEDGSDLFLLPTDGDPELLELTSLMRNQLFDQIAELNPKHVTVFLDTCYSGASRTEEILVASRPVVIEAKEQDIPTNFTIFSASSSTETAKVLEEAEHGLFSYYMMKGLEGDADANSDNQITNGELFAFINKNVSRQADQTPQLNGIADQVLTKW